MADKIRWGVLSTANIGRARVIPAIQQSTNGVVAAVASRNLERARTFASELGIPTAYGSYEELLADPNIDAIYNPLPNAMHAEWSIKAAEAGKPTLCEKPLASNAAEAQQMVDAFAARDVLFAEAFMYRFHPQTQRVKAMIEEGAVGQVKMIVATFSFYMPDDRAKTDVRLNKELAGGSLMDVGCYCVNVLRLMAGEEPSAVKAFARPWSSGVDVSLTGVMEFPSGVLGHFDSSLRAVLKNSYEIRGTEGRIVVDPSFTMPPNEATAFAYDKGGSIETIALEPANHYTIMAEDFADALINGRPPRYAPQDAVANMAVIDRLYESAGM